MTKTWLYAWVLCLVSAISSAFCYQKLLEYEDAHSRVFTGIRIGKTYYGIGTEAHCVGTLTIDAYNDREGIAIDTKGEINISLAKDLHTIQIIGEAHFNALKQLGGAYIRMSGSGGAITVSLQNIHPVLVKAQIKRGSDTQEYKSSIPGPITVVSRNKSLFIESSFLSSQIPSFLHLQEQPLMKNFSLFIGDEKAVHEQCRASKGNNLALDPFLQLLKNIHSVIPMLGESL